MNQDLEAIAAMSKVHRALESTLFLSWRHQYSEDYLRKFYNHCWIESTIEHGSCIGAAKKMGVWGFRKLYEFKVIDTYRRALEVLRNGTTD